MAIATSFCYIPVAARNATLVFPDSSDIAIFAAMAGVSSTTTTAPACPQSNRYLSRYHRT